MMNESVFDSTSGPQQADHGSMTSQDFLGPARVVSQYSASDFSPHRLDWLFSEASLHDLYCMAYVDTDTLMTDYWAQ